MSVCTNELRKKERKKKKKNCKRTKVANVRPHIYFAWLDDKSVEEEQWERNKKGKSLHVENHI